MTVQTEIQLTPLAIGSKPGSLRDSITTALRVLDTDQVVKKKTEHVFRILNPADGDKRLIWDSLSLEEIREAHKSFNDLVEKGMVPYKVDLSGKKTPEVMQEFDPTAEEILFAPIQAVAGGLR